MDLLDKVLTESTLFETYQGKPYDDLLLALRLADEKITARLAKTKGEWTKQRLNEMKALVNDEIGNAYGGLFEGLQDEGVEVANAVYGFYLADTAATVPTAVMKDIINSKRNIQGYEFKELFKLTQDNHARQLKVVIASGVAQGRSVENIIRDYQLKSDKLSKGQLKTNINTFIAETRTISRNESYKKLEARGAIKAYYYNAYLDSGTTPWCRAHNGRVYDTLEDINKDLHTHFNERSVASPITNSKIENDRLFKFGKDEANNFPAWYKEQSDKFHRITLTDKQYELYKQGNFKLSSLNDLTKKQTLDSINKAMK